MRGVLDRASGARAGRRRAARRGAASCGCARGAAQGRSARTCRPRGARRPHASAPCAPHAPRGAAACGARARRALATRGRGSAPRRPPRWPSQGHLPPRTPAPGTSRHSGGRQRARSQRSERRRAPRRALRRGAPRPGCRSSGRCWRGPASSALAPVRAGDAAAAVARARGGRRERGRGGRPHARGASRGRPGSCCCAQRRAGGRVGGQGSLVGGAARLKLRLLALARVHLPDGQLLCHEFQPVGAPSDDRHAAVGACGRRGESGASTCQSVHSRAGEGRGSAGPARRGAHPCRRCARARTLPQTSARRGPSSR